MTSCGMATCTSVLTVQQNQTNSLEVEVVQRTHVDALKGCGLDGGEGATALIIGF